MENTTYKNLEWGQVGTLEEQLEGLSSYTVERDKMGATIHLATGREIRLLDVRFFSEAEEKEEYLEHASSWDDRP